MLGNQQPTTTESKPHIYKIFPNDLFPYVYISCCKSEVCVFNLPSLFATPTIYLIEDLQIILLGLLCILVH